MEIGKIIKKLRAERKISQERLALESSLSRKYLYSLESDRASPTINTIESIAKTLRIKVSTLIELAENLNDGS